MTKVCTVCKIEKPLEAFSPRKDSKCGVRAACKLTSRNYHSTCEDFYGKAAEYLATSRKGD